MWHVHWIIGNDCSQANMYQEAKRNFQFQKLKFFAIWVWSLISMTWNQLQCSDRRENLPPSVITYVTQEVDTSAWSPTFLKQRSMNFWWKLEFGPKPKPSIITNVTQEVDSSAWSPSPPFLVWISMRIYLNQKPLKQRGLHLFSFFFF